MPIFNGTAAADTLIGSAFADQLYGYAGNDVLEGLGGDDLLDGGAGDDVASFIGATAAVFADIAAGRASGGSGNERLLSIENLFGSDFGDALRGDAGSNYIAGRAGHDTMFGAGGNDLFDGGTGDDIIDGGEGDDAVFYDTPFASANVRYSAATGQYTVGTPTEGTDVVANVERFFFGGVAYSAAQLVGDITAPVVLRFDPADESLAVPVGASISVTFNETIARGSGQITLRTAAGTVIETFDAATSSRITVAGSVLNIDPTALLAPGTGYRVEIGRGAVRDTAGNPYGGTGDYNFTTAVALPTLALRGSDGSEADGAVSFVVTLSRASTVPVTVSFTTRSDGTASAGADFAAQTQTLTFAPGQRSIEVTVPVTNDRVFEPTEAVYARLGDPVGATIEKSDDYALVFDNDTPYPLPGDGLFTLQWHLYPASGANVLQVWADYTGAGVRVGVFDQGIDPRHVDLDGNLLTPLGRQASNLAPGGAPQRDGDNHGTPVAGVIAAERNGTGVVGVAYGASLVSIYTPFGMGPSSIVNAYQHARSVDVLNDSWGYAPQYYTNEPWAFTDNFRDPRFAAAGAALKALADQGRGGLGTIVVQSAGNSSRFGDDTNLHNFQNSRYIVTVAATDYLGRITEYSSPGASVLLAAPGGGGDDPLSDIWTTDRAGSAGRVAGDYVPINGTSFSAPVISGVAALMLEANPNLGWRDVQQILAYSARQTDGADHSWRYNGAGNWNGGGLHYDAVTHDLGFGLVDARAAVRLAETWRGPAATSANLAETSARHALPQTIPDKGMLQQRVVITQPIDVERVEVTIDLRHGFIGDLALLLTSPAGTHSWLLWRPAQNAQSPFGTAQDNIDFTFTSVLSMGESSVGTWTLSVFDEAAGDVGQLRSWTLNLVGKSASADDVYVYTDEYAEALGASAARGTLADSGGFDVLNAAALSTACTINLNPGASSLIDGRLLNITAGTVIEAAYGGDGHDVISGNAAANQLFGMRGNDRLSGGAGDDLIDGGAGLDTAQFAGPRGAYLLARVAGALTVSSGAEDTDMLRSVERLAFADRSLALDIGGNAGAAAKAIGALYGPRFLADRPLVGSLLALLDGGTGYAELVAGLVAGNGFAQRAGSHSNIDFVRYVYRNVVGVDPPPGDLQYYAGLLNAGVFTQASLALLACETGLNAANVDLVGLAASGLEFVPMGGG
jgi:subtilisin-like proprotein convertase family protein